MGTAKKSVKAAAPPEAPPEAPEAAKLAASRKKKPPKGKKRVESSPHKARVKKLVELILALPGEKGALLDEVERVVASAKTAGRRYEREHWGRKAPYGLMQLRAADPSSGEVFPGLGELEAVVYVTAKGEDKGRESYEHRFGKPRPRLLYSPLQGGMLIIAGGRYTVTERGIEG